MTFLINFNFDERTFYLNSYSELLLFCLILLLSILHLLLNISNLIEQLHTFQILSNYINEMKRVFYIE
jgi:hypothetical protein